MAYQSENRYRVTFKDGSSFESKGNSSSEVKDLSVEEEFKWVSFHITKEVLARGKKITDVISIEYNMYAHSK